MSKPNFTATIDFTHDSDASDPHFDDQEDFNRWESSLRESCIAVVLARLKMQAKKLGLTEAEWARAVLDQVERSLKRMK